MKKYLKNQNGASAVEFAILLPVLVALVCGVIEIGMLLYNQQVLTNASREGARAAIIGECADRLTNEQIGTIVTDYCTGRLVSLGGANTPPTTTVTPSPSGCTSGVGDDVSVTAQYTYTFLVPAVLGFGPTRLLSAATVMKMESNP